MDESLAQWLRLREAADWAHGPALTHIANAVPNQARTRARPRHRNGSNLRYLSERLPSPQRWLLVDRGDLLALVRRARRNGPPNA
jgi:hypothetical protein